MSSQAAVWLLLAVALIAANLPWCSERILFVLPMQQRRGKPEWLRLLEWLLLYGVVGIVALGLEERLQGRIHEQDWEFFVATLCLFVVFALPGFLYHHDLRRHLRKRQRPASM